jgi:malic enzyme
LPIVLDVGTNNEELLQDDFYLGVQKKRLRGREYFHMVDEFMHAVRYRWPNVLVQFEDFDSSVAQKLLDKYRDTHLVFNDDIQGTGSTVLAGLLGALRSKGEDVKNLGDQRIVIAGAGSAGIGIGQVLYQAMLEQGCSPEKARNAFYVCDQHGLLGTERIDSLSAEQAVFARPEDDNVDGLPLLKVIQTVKPTIFLGVTAVGGLFTEELVREMASHVERPIIFPLSNPTTKAECTAEQAFEWTEGRCIFASGSPFDAVEMDDGRTFYPSQCNNSKCGCRLVAWVCVCVLKLGTYMYLLLLTVPSPFSSLPVYVFPGLGLGATLCGAKKVTDRMLYVAAVALAEFVPPEDLAKGQVFPHISKIREVSHRIAVAVIKEAMATPGLATKVTSEDAQDLEGFVARKMYYPEYVPLVEKRNVTI